MNPAATLYTSAVSLCVGIALGLLFPFSAQALALLFFLSGAALLLSAIVRKKFVTFVALALIMSVLGAWRTSAFLAHENLHALDVFENSSVMVSGTVANDPDVRATEVRANVKLDAIDGAVASGQVQAVFAPGTVLAFGQSIEAQGTLEVPQDFKTDNGGTFEYQQYLRVQGVSFLLQRATLISSTRAPLSLRGLLYEIKHAANASLERLLPQPEGSLMEGILLGERRGLPQALSNAFIFAGLIHIVILSGYSMSVVAEGTLRAFKFLPKRAALALAFITIIVFVLMTGAAATAVRAASMAIIALIARYFGRQTAALRSLAVVAAAMVLISPLILLYDSAFIVSVLSTFSLIAFGGRVEAMLTRSITSKELRAIFASTLAVQILALPALIYFTGNVSFIALPANLLVLPLLPLIMLAGLLAAALGIASTALATVPAFIADVLLRYVLAVVATSAALPGSHASIGSFPLALAIFVYVPLLAIAIWLVRRSALRTQTS